MEKLDQQVQISIKKVEDLKELEYPIIFCYLGSKTQYYLKKSRESLEIELIAEQNINYNIISKLIHRISQNKDIQEAIEQGIKEGKSTNCDLTVGDIYGQDSEQYIKMNSNVLASSLGKVSQMRATQKDYVKSLSNIFSMETCQHASFLSTSKGAHSFVFIDTVVKNTSVLLMLQKTLQFYSQGKLDPIFMTNIHHYFLKIK